jgi:uncharacterized Fe-S cluster-containing radical SAM superfamily enzyme
MEKFSTYELVCEVIRRIQHTNGMEFVSMRQLTLLSKAFIEEMAKRYHALKRVQDKKD